MDDDHADDLLRRALIDADASAAVALRVQGLPLCDTLTVVFHGRRDLGTIQTYVAHGGRGAGASVAARRAAARPVRPRPRRRRGPRRGRARSTPSRRPRCATRSSAPTRCSTSGASRSRSSSARASTVDRSVAARRPPAGAPAAAGRARRARAADRRRRRLRRAAAGRGPPADGDRVRPAGRRARLPAARRPGALPRGLPRASPPSTRASWPSSSIARRPRSSASSSSRATTSHARPASLRGRAPRRASLHPRRLRRLRLPRHLAAARPRLTGSGNERAEVLALRARPGARRRRSGARPAARLPRASPPARTTTRDRVAELRRPGAVQMLTYTPSTRLALTRKTGTGRVAWRAGDGLPVVQCVRVRRDGPLTGGAVELLSVLGPDRRRGGCAP